MSRKHPCQVLNDIKYNSWPNWRIYRISPDLPSQVSVRNLLWVNLEALSSFRGISASRSFPVTFLPQELESFISYPISSFNRATVNTLRPRQNGRHFADHIFKCIFLNENVRIPIKISLKFVPKGPINNIPSLVQIMAWHRPGDKPLSEPMIVTLLTHICVTRPQWVNTLTASGPFNHHGLTLISAWIRNYMPSKVWDAITYPFPNFNGCTVEVW